MTLIARRFSQGLIMCHLFSAGAMMIIAKNFVGGIAAIIPAICVLEFSEYESSVDRIAAGFHATFFGINISRDYLTSRWWCRIVYVVMSIVLCMSDKRFNDMWMYVYLANLWPLIC